MKTSKELSPAIILLSIFTIFLLEFSKEADEDNERIPIVALHGFYAFASDFNRFENYLKKVQPERQFHSIRAAERIDSIFKTMDQQLTLFRTELNSLDFVKARKPFHLLCHSGGALICRKYIETTNNHTVQSFLSIAGPHMGQFGVPIYEDFSTIFTRNFGFRILYTEIAQRTLSISNYWKDPFNLNLYLKNVHFLPQLNNEIEHDNSEDFRKNLWRLKKFLLFGSPDDEIIKPQISSLFGFVSAEISETDGKWVLKSVPMEELPTYHSLGLKEMKENLKNLERFEFKGMKHSDWLYDETKYELYLKLLD